MDQLLRTCKGYPINVESPDARDDVVRRFQRNPYEGPMRTNRAQAVVDALASVRQQDPFTTVTQRFFLPMSEELPDEYIDVISSLDAESIRYMNAVAFRNVVLGEEV